MMWCLFLLQCTSYMHTYERFIFGASQASKMSMIIKITYFQILHLQLYGSNRSGWCSGKTMPKYTRVCRKSTKCGIVTISHIGIPNKNCWIVSERLVHAKFRPYLILKCAYTGPLDATKFLCMVRSTELFGTISLLYSTIVPIGKSNSLMLIDSISDKS